jgi:hypothetical protein
MLRRANDRIDRAGDAYEQERQGGRRSFRIALALFAAIALVFGVLGVIGFTASPTNVELGVTATAGLVITALLACWLVIRLTRGGEK